ncbi:acylphosphatase [Candidatus Sumerlaeota bacterium]|nr:acylphosphatase [Candidatus Sumerlaeota bacterium]
MSRLKARVSGIVQGVGFRFFVIRHAENLDLKGWVRNTNDGDVELEAEGDPENLKTLVEELHKGPSMSRVTDVNVEWFTEDKGYESFSLKW